MGYPCDRFAAFLAHVLNSDSMPAMRLDAGGLYIQVIDALSGRFAEPLLHWPGYSWRMTAEEAATRYFDATLARRLILSGRVELSTAHRVMEAMCRRGSPAGWVECRLVREPLPAHQQRRPPEAGLGEPLRQRLASLPQGLSAGSASPTIRSRSGAIVLQLGEERIPVPEELSTWDAVTCGPGTVASLPAGEPFNQFCGLMIDCVRTANRPFQEVLGLGRHLCPFDWLEVLSIQQVRALRRFLGHLEHKGASDSADDWSAAFQMAPVPGFKSGAALWESEIGFALRNAAAGGLAALESMAELDDPDADTAGILGEDEFLQQLGLLEADRVIDAAERVLLGQLYRGAELDDLKDWPDIRATLRRRAMTLSALIVDLQHRVEHWNQTTGANP